MPYSTAGKNLMLNAIAGTNPTTPITHAGLLTKGANKSITSVASTDLFTSTSHGYSAGDLVVFSGLTGGAGLVAGHPFFVIAAGLTANDFAVSLTSGGSSFDHTTNVTAGTVNKLTEISGGSPAYARKTIAFSAAAGGTMDDSTNGAIVDVPASTVDYVSFHSAVTAGTLLAIDDVTQEVFAAQGTYTITDADLDLLNGAGA
jgi:hypothetical protein